MSSDEVMKLILLTTDTAHHLYFASRVNEHFPFQAILLETNHPVPRYDTDHPFETLRDAYEREVLLSGLKLTFNEIADTRRVESVNEAGSLVSLRRFSPDVIIVFGTGKLLLPVIHVPSIACLNLHGGNPERYRGLDTHLWAVYHRDFNDLVTTLHHVDSSLDTGDIVFQSQLRLHRDCRLYELRSMNTKLCVDLTLLALQFLKTTGRLTSRRQVSQGRYYSFMPSTLKEECLRNFNQHIADLSCPLHK